jgi:hypothetical protein
MRARAAFKRKKGSLPATWRWCVRDLGRSARAKRQVYARIFPTIQVVSPVTGAFFGPAGSDLSVGVWVSEL